MSQIGNNPPPAGEQHNRTAQQQEYWQSLQSNLEDLLHLPQNKPGQCIPKALDLLHDVLAGPEHLGPMTIEYFHTLFNIGQQALEIMAEAVSQYRGEMKSSLYGMEWCLADLPDDDNAYRQLRRIYIRYDLKSLARLHNQALARVDVARWLFWKCSGVAFTVTDSTGTHLVPRLRVLDQAWFDECCPCGIFAIIKLAQTLSARFGGMAVSIWGQVATGTGCGADSEMLESWIALPEDEMQEYIRGQVPAQDDEIWVDCSW